MNTYCFCVKFCRWVFSNLNVVIFFSIKWLLTVCDFTSPHTGTAEGGVVCLKQEQKEVKWCYFCEVIVFHIIFVCLGSFIFNVLYFIFYFCPQLMNDVDYKLSENSGFGNANLKNEGSLDFSNCTNKQGKTVICLILAL